MLLDANLLLFAEDESNPFHEPSVRWLTDALNGPVRVGLPWPSLLAFVRIRTYPRAYEHPLSGDEAWSRVALPDAHLAALAIEHGVAVCSADTDFARFTELRWTNPLRPTEWDASKPRHSRGGESRRLRVSAAMTRLRRGAALSLSLAVGAAGCSSG